MGRCTSQTRRGDLKAAVVPQPPTDKGETQMGSLLHPVLLSWVRSDFGQGVRRIRMERDFKYTGKIYKGLCNFFFMYMSYLLPPPLFSVRGCF